MSCRNEDDQVEEMFNCIMHFAREADSKPIPCIYRVPEGLRKVKESAYTPRLVSIGPLHSKDEHLKRHMQRIKMSHVNYILCRITNGSPDAKYKVLKKCADEMKACIDEAKGYYAEQVEELNKEMLVTDGLFILEHLYRYAESGESSSQNMLKNGLWGDPILCGTLTRVAVQHDLLLLENQLPFFVLEKLFDNTVALIPNRSPCLSLREYVISYFCKVANAPHKSSDSNATKSPPSECVHSIFVDTSNSEGVGRSTSEESGKIYHFLHLLHIHYLGHGSLEGPKEEDRREFMTTASVLDLKGKDPLKDRREFMTTASVLDYAGVKFEPASEGKGPLNVEFKGRGCFKIPTICINDLTEPFLRNLIAFEQLCPRTSLHFTSYAFLMDSLVTTAKDVEVLERTGVIRNSLRTREEASDIFNNLCKEVIRGQFYYAEQCQLAVKYSELCWPKAMAYLKSKYFSSPWTFIAFCAAFIVFGTQVTQFITSYVG